MVAGIDFSDGAVGDLEDPVALLVDEGPFVRNEQEQRAGGLLQITQDRQDLCTD